MLGCPMQDTVETSITAKNYNRIFESRAESCEHNLNINTKLKEISVMKSDQKNSANERRNCLKLAQTSKRW